MQESYPPTQQFTAPKSHYTVSLAVSQPGISVGLCVRFNAVRGQQNLAPLLLSHGHPRKAPGAEPDPGGNTVETSSDRGGFCTKKSFQN